ncbi:MAG: hypothetical protein JF615_04305 [Asticcacaulis sp.]|nr:hypothetical protein [Asticcacaulis sp.]
MPLRGTRIAQMHCFQTGVQRQSFLKGFCAISHIRGIRVAACGDLRLIRVADLISRSNAGHRYSPLPVRQLIIFRPM